MTFRRRSGWRKRAAWRSRTSSWLRPTSTPLMADRSDVVDAVEEAFRTTEAAGHGDEDMAAVVHAFRPAGS